MTRQSIRTLIVTFLISLFSGGMMVWSGGAQPINTCTADIERSFARAQAVCADLERNNACYGAGRVSITSFDAANTESFERPGDTIALGNLETLTLSSPTSVIFLRSMLGLAPIDERSNLLMLFGDAALTNQIAPIPTITVTAETVVNIRQLPEADSDILGRAALNTSLRANGRSSDSAWLHVNIPNTTQQGWVSADLVSANAALDTLLILTLDTPVRSAFDEFTLTTRDNAECASTLASGLLLQTPNLEDAARFTFNGVAVEAVGTVFLQSDTETIIQVLEGHARLENTVVPAGAQLVIGENRSAEPYPLAEGDFTLTQYLDRMIVLPPPLSQADILASNQPIATTPEATAVLSEPTCAYVLRRSENVRAGAGRDYEVVNTFRAGTVVTPISQSTTDTGIWLHIQPDGWLPADAVEIQGTCPALVEAPYPSEPYRNALSLERCIPENGSIQPGQQVELDFVPDPFINYPTALIATRNNRGRITVNGIRLHTVVTDPIRLDDDNFIRRFSAVWTAQSGTARIVGRHSAYTVECTITVSPGN